jgi:hypothetical protein
MLLHDVFLCYAVVPRGTEKSFRQWFVQWPARDDSTTESVLVYYFHRLWK